MKSDKEILEFILDKTGRIISADKCFNSRESQSWLMAKQLLISEKQEERQVELMKVLDEIFKMLKEELL